MYTQFLAANLVDELHLAVAPFFVGDSRAPRFVADAAFRWTSDRRATLAEVRQIGDMVLMRYALSDRFTGHEAEGHRRLTKPQLAAGMT
jgi:5-amino-6-(5-phosphoribosylamino)uracil reductase